MNAVLNLLLTSLCGKTVTAGQCAKVAVECETEDEKPLGSKAALDGLAVKMAQAGSVQQATSLRLLSCENATQHSYSFESDPLIKAGASLLQEP